MSLIKKNGVKRFVSEGIQDMFKYLTKTEELSHNRHVVGYQFPERAFLCTEVFHFNAISAVRPWQNT